MVSRLALVLLLFGLLGDTGGERGRAGNAFYEQGRYADAVAAYRDGLAALKDTTGATYAALQNNLGAALLRQQEYRAAAQALRRARRAAPTDTARVRALVNAGAAAAGRGAIGAALRHYRAALVLDPTHEAARHNYEYLKRQQAGQRDGADQERVSPSPYARQLKQKAEALVARRRYAEAAALMEEGLRQDSTVRAYRDFIGRLSDITQISNTP